MSNVKSVAAVLGAMAIAAPAVNANDNPFQMTEFGQTIVVATDARDMKGNAVKIDDQTGFTYGGDNTGAYGGNKVGTGKKDPKVCGTFGSATCSIKYVDK